MSSNNYQNEDFLTGLFNRRYCLKSLNQILASNTPAAIFIIDLNNFKLVNDVYGHDVGDEVLKEVGRRFKQLERDNLVFGRFGGDEFAAVYKSRNIDKINQIGKEIKESLKEHIVVSESEFSISASIGVSRYPEDSNKISDLLKLADMAMYHAKKNEIDDSYLISDELNNKLSKRRRIENLLKHIDIKDELFLEYQPIFNLKTTELQGMEALVRWNHPIEGIIYPLEFINVAEEMDIIKDVTRWVFIEALHQIKEWNEKYNKNLKISLNVSDNCIHNKIFFGNVQSMLKEFKVKASWLSIELSEFSLSVSPEYMKHLLVAINDFGIDIFINNFGTSAFKISDLRDFKINTIKINKDYVRMLEEEKDTKIVNAMILMAHALDINVSAECVETEKQKQELLKYNCDFFQGNLKAPALSKEEFEEKFLKA